MTIVSNGVQFGGGVIFSPVINSLYDFSTFTFTSNIVGPLGPTLGNLYNTYSNAGNTWLTNTEYFTVPSTWQGYQIWTVPRTGPYQITAAGSRSGILGVFSANTTYGNAHGRGAVVQGVFNLQRGQKITLVVGQPSANTSQVSTYESTAGGGGSFVALGNIASDGFANLTPLIIGGGGGGAGAWSSNTSSPLPGGYGVTTRRGGNSAGYLNASGLTNRTGAPGGVNGLGGNTHVNINGVTSLNGFDSGAGSGWSGNGITWTSTTWTANTRVAPSTQGGGGGTSFQSNAVGGMYSTSYAPPATNLGGFGGGGGSGPITGGGGGGYSGGGGAYGGAATTVDSGGGGGSYIDSNATSVATSDGQFDLSGTFNGTAITSLGFYNNTAGYISIVRI
jgi:hypothetical protein